MSYQAMKRYGLSEKRQSRKATCFMIPTMWHSRKGKTMETEKNFQWLQAEKEGESMDKYMVHRKFGEAVKLFYMIL